MRIARFRAFFAILHEPRGALAHGKMVRIGSPLFTPLLSCHLIRISALFRLRIIVIGGESVKLDNEYDGNIYPHLRVTPKVETAKFLH